MIARLVATALCVGASAAGAAGLFWVFLNTPESNAWMLGASAALLLLVAAVTATGVSTAVLVAGRVTFGEALSRSLRGLHWFALSGLAGLAAWWGVGAASRWVEGAAGEISAWFIATFGWSDVTSLFTAVAWAGRWLQWVVLPVGVIGVVAACLSRTPGSPLAAGLARAWHWRTLALATIVFAAFILLPWQLTAWRPPLPDTWVQLVTAGARLGAAGLLMTIGAALLIVLVAPQAEEGRDTSKHASAP